MRVPLIEGQGNFGSMDPDPPAAMRYTEARLAKVANFLLGDIDKDTVNFQPNYDASESEPQVLPARFPNLLVNGAGGIAVGMATNIPPHNLGEVLAACRAYIEDPAITVEGLMEHVKGPDFPTGALILGRIASNRVEDRLRRFLDAWPPGTTRLAPVPRRSRRLPPAGESGGGDCWRCHPFAALARRPPSAHPHLPRKPRLLR